MGNFVLRVVAFDLSRDVSSFEAVLDRLLFPLGDREINRQKEELGAFVDRVSVRACTASAWFLNASVWSMYPKGDGASVHG